MRKKGDIKGLNYMPHSSAEKSGRALIPAGPDHIFPHILLSLAAPCV